MKVKEERENFGLKLYSQKTKIMAFVTIIIEGNLPDRLQPGNEKPHQRDRDSVKNLSQGTPSRSEKAVFQTEIISALPQFDKAGAGESAQGPVRRDCDAVQCRP